MRLRWTLGIVLSLLLAGPALASPLFDLAKPPAKAKPPLADKLPADTLFYVGWAGVDANRAIELFEPLLFLRDESNGGRMAIEMATGRTPSLRSYVMKRFHCIVPTEVGWESFLTLLGNDPSVRPEKMNTTATQWFRKTPAQRAAAFETEEGEEG